MLSSATRSPLALADTDNPKQPIPEKSNSPCSVIEDLDSDDVKHEWGLNKMKDENEKSALATLLSISNNFEVTNKQQSQNSSTATNTPETITEITPLQRRQHRAEVVKEAKKRAKQLKAAEGSKFEASPVEAPVEADAHDDASTGALSKKEQRRLNNRKSAEQSRKRKREQLEQLEEQVQSLQQQVTQLKTDKLSLQNRLSKYEAVREQARQTGS